MSPVESAARLEEILLAENEALARHDAVTATALLDEKLAAAKALSATGLSMAQGERLRALAAENRRLLERAIKVQGRIVAMLAKAAQASPAVSRYGAKGRAVVGAGAFAVAREA
jgi:flagellar biosynthesis/type III secretory pathway chaperone